MTVHISPGSFESGSITHEQKNGGMGKNHEIFTRIVKSASSARTMKRDLCGDVFHNTLPAYMLYRTMNNTRKRVTKPVALRGVIRASNKQRRIRT